VNPARFKLQEQLVGTKAPVKDETHVFAGKVVKKVTYGFYVFYGAVECISCCGQFGGCGEG
jgi:hypothetical protein